MSKIALGHHRQTPGRLESICRSLQHVVPSHLADTALFDFTRLGHANGEGFLTQKWLVAEEPQ